jgi:predicted RNase H-like nuclease (RuvC/YqgF family)
MLCRSKRETQAQHESEIRAVYVRVTELEKESRELRDNNYALESRVSELSHKLDSRDGQVASLSEELTRLQQQYQETSRYGLLHFSAASYVTVLQNTLQAFCLCNVLTLHHGTGDVTLCQSDSALCCTVERLKQMFS